MKYRLLCFLALIIFSPSPSLARLDSVSTSVGKGAEYNLELKGASSKVAIYFGKNPGPNQKAVEMYFTTQGSITPVQLWQRFHISESGSSSLQVAEGYVHSSLFQTRKLDEEYLKGFDGVQMSQFLISSREQLQKHHVAKEAVKVPAGEVNADHYRVERAGQTVDFWIHHKTQPIGLVKIISTGAKPEQNYTMSMNRLLTGVAEKIDPSKAEPMDAKTKAFFPKPGSGGNSSSSGFSLF